MGEPEKKEPDVILGVRYENNKIPLRGVKWHQVTAEDATLENLAGQNHLRATDLALINWNTIDEKEINWYLYNFVGCRNHNEKQYTFSGTENNGSGRENSGWILVLDIPASIKKGPAQTVDAVRKGAATLDSKLKVQVVEILPDGSMPHISGKWLYVFSGSGVDFGYAPPAAPKAASAGDQPGSAFTLNFPGEYHIKEKPDKLEYEIYISSEEAPNINQIPGFIGSDSTGKPKFEYGRKWYFLSDPTVLAKAKTESRADRFKEGDYKYQNEQSVIIDLAPNGENRRFYFLLSPVQLGPEAIKYAMDNPSGLTPLLRGRGQIKKDDDTTIDTDPSRSRLDDPGIYFGPTLEDIDKKKNPIILLVIDPYAWAENIAEVIYKDSSDRYEKWINSGNDETVKNLTNKTLWTLDHLFVAQVLKSVIANHPKALSSELEDYRKLLDKLSIWEYGLTQRNAEILAAAHRCLIQLIKWLEGPAHKIIETAILKDTAQSPDDSIDIGHGIMHWAICTDQMLALEPGVKFLIDVLNKKGSVAYDMALKYLRDLDKPTFSPSIPDTVQNGWQWGYQGLFMLLALSYAVSPPPSISFGTQEEYHKKLGAILQTKSDNLIKLINDLEIFPVQLKALSPLSSYRGKFTWSNVTSILLSTLDIVDKINSRHTNPHITKGFLGNQIASKIKWLSERSPKWMTIGKFTWGFKAAANFVAFYNLHNAYTTSRYDYQTNKMTVSTLDYANAGSSVTISVLDAISELVKEDATLSRLFPVIAVPKEAAHGKYWMNAAKVEGVVGTVFASVTVIATLVSGATTMISMHQSRNQSVKLGDYTAAKYYEVGFIGGAMVVTGAAALGFALLGTGLGVSATGIGAPVGLVLIAIGTIVTVISSFFVDPKDDFQTFALKCFLGKEGNFEPRFGDNPPNWSHASTSGEDTWSIYDQKRAIINLLGRFTLKTEAVNQSPSKLAARTYQGQVRFEITPGLLMPGSIIEMELYYENGTQKTSVAFQWNGNYNAYSPNMATADSKGGLFDTEKAVAFFASKKISILIDILNYDGFQDKLLTTVTLHYPGYNNFIRTKKLVMGLEPLLLVLKADSNEETSNLFY